MADLTRYGRFSADNNLREAIRELSNQLNINNGAYNNTKFVIHCRKCIRKILGKHFQIQDYYYDIITDNKLPASDIYITIKE